MTGHKNNFTQKGFEVTSIDEIMAGADMTRGAFYAHFSSKSELYREALIHAAEKTRLRYNKPDKTTEQSWLKVLLRGYLHNDHVQQKGTASCPLAFLATDVAVRDQPVRSAYTDAFRTMNNLVAGYTNSQSASDRNTILAATAMLIGAVAVARALDDQQLTDDLLKSCKHEVNKMLEKT